MDAKMRADFVNSVASGQKVPCPVCNTLNDPDGSFCIACGYSLKKEKKKSENSDRVICPVCQNANKRGFRFCTICGNKLDDVESTKSNDSVSVQPTVSPSQPVIGGQQPKTQTQDVQRNMNRNIPQEGAAFETVKKPTAVPIRKNLPTQTKPARKKKAFNFVEPEIEEYKEPVSVFAQGLPAWDIVPPQIMVRRKKKK